jgi:hypothetical protein
MGEIAAYISAVVSGRPINDATAPSANSALC